MLITLTLTAAAANSPGRRTAFRRLRRSATTTLPRANTSHQPLDHFPALVLDTLDGPFNTSCHDAPIIFNAHDPSNAFSTCLWGYDASVDELILRGAASSAPRLSPPTSHFVFLSYASAAGDDVRALRARFQARLRALGAPDPSAFMAHLHFVPTPLTQLPAVGRALRSLPTFADRVTVDGLAGGPRVLPRLDARYDWLGWSFDPSDLGNASLPLVAVADGCAEPPAASLTNRVALVSNASASGCDYFGIARAAQRGNASAVIVYASPGHVAIDMNCAGASECTPPAGETAVGLPLTMVSHDDGAALARALGGGAALRARFSTVESRGTDFLLASGGGGGAVRESWGGSGLGSGAVDGNPGDPSAKLYPRMSFLAWAARWELYRQRVEREVAADGAAVVPLFEAQSLRPAGGDCYGDAPWGCGPSAVARVPAAPEKLQLEMALGCNGTRDVDCPQWDHVVQLRACAPAPCDAQAGS